MLQSAIAIIDVVLSLRGTDFQWFDRLVCFAGGSIYVVDDCLSCYDSSLGGFTVIYLCDPLLAQKLGDWVDDVSRVYA